jgi:hypothetical protein
MNRCPAYGKICYNCQNLHHFARVCRNKTVNIVNEDQYGYEQEGASQYPMYEVYNDRDNQDQLCVVQ